MDFQTKPLYLSFLDNGCHASNSPRSLTERRIFRIVIPIGLTRCLRHNRWHTGFTDEGVKSSDIFLNHRLELIQLDIDLA